MMHLDSWREFILAWVVVLIPSVVMMIWWMWP